MLELKSAQIVCLDGTYGTTSHKTNLFTMLVRDDVGGHGIHFSY